MILALHSTAMANDYSITTNLVMKNRVPWRVAVFFIDNFIDEGQERTAAVGALIGYQSTSLVPHLIRLSKDGNPAVRMSTFWPLYKNGERKAAIQLLQKELADNNRAACLAFYHPHQFGKEFKLAISKDDTDFREVIISAATNQTQDPLVRIYAGIHLATIGENEIAAGVAEDILKKDKGLSQIRRLAEWCLELAGHKKP